MYIYLMGVSLPSFWKGHKWVVLIPPSSPACLWPGQFPTRSFRFPVPASTYGTIESWIMIRVNPPIFTRLTFLFKCVLLPSQTMLGTALPFLLCFSLIRTLTLLFESWNEMPVMTRDQTHDLKRHTFKWQENVILSSVIHCWPTTSLYPKSYFSSLLDCLQHETSSETSQRFIHLSIRSSIYPCLHPIEVCETVLSLFLTFIVFTLDPFPLHLSLQSRRFKSWPVFVLSSKKTFHANIWLRFGHSQHSQKITIIHFLKQPGNCTVQYN